MLESDLRPTNLVEQVRAVVLGGRSGGLDVDDLESGEDFISHHERGETRARDLGAAVSINDSALSELLPDILCGGTRAWSFGRDLAATSLGPRVTWARMVDALERLSPEQRNVQALRGFLAELWDQDRELVQALLDEALDHSALAVYLPVLQSAVYLDARGLGRFKKALNSDVAPIQMYRELAYGRTTDFLTGSDLKDLLVLIADKQDGFDVALEILSMHLYLDQSAKREHDPVLLEAGRELMHRVKFKKGRDRDDYNLATLARACLRGGEGGPVASTVAKRLKRAVEHYESYAFQNDQLLKSLLDVQPTAVLDALFAHDGDSGAIELFDHLGSHRPNPADAITCDTLIDWCRSGPETRYSLMASIVAFARSAGESGPRVWSEQAKALLANAPDPRAVLTIFVERFKPMSWSGSRAAIVEANSHLLDLLDVEIEIQLRSYIMDVRNHLLLEASRQRQYEKEYDQQKDERFE